MESKNPIEHKDYLVMRHLMFRIVSDPSFAKTIDRQTDDFFEGNQTFKDMYMIVQQEYRSNKFNAPIQLAWLRTELAGRLDRMNATVEERGAYDYMLQDTYVVDMDLNGIKEMNKTTSKYMKKIRMTNAIKKAVANDLTDEAIDLMIESSDKINRETAERDIPRAMNVLDPEMHKELADQMQALLESKYPTYLEGYNNVLGGGLGRGEMGCIGGKSGNGKTLHSSALAVGYALSGLNVVYYALEELTPRMVHRFVKNIIGTVIQVMKNQGDTNISKDFVRTISSIEGTQKLLSEGDLTNFLGILRNNGMEIGNLYLLKYPPYTMTVADLQYSMTDLTVNQGINLDVMVIDYPDLMSYDIREGESEAGGKLFASIRGIGQEFDVITWVLTQLNRTTYGTKLYTEAHLEGSYRKQNALEFLGIINQEHEEFEAGFTRLYVAKARNTTKRGEIVHFAVDRTLGHLRDETTLEAVQHNRILEELDQDGGEVRKASNSTEKAQQQLANYGKTVNAPPTQIESNVPTVPDAVKNLPKPPAPPKPPKQ